MDLMVIYVKHVNIKYMLLRPCPRHSKLNSVSPPTSVVKVPSYLFNFFTGICAFPRFSVHILNRDGILGIIDLVRLVKILFGIPMTNTRYLHIRVVGTEVSKVTTKGD